LMLLANPFRVQMALTRAIEACTETMTGKAAIVLRVLEGRERPCLEITCECESRADADMKDSVDQFDSWREFLELTSILSIGVQWIQGPEVGFTLTFTGAAPESQEQSTPRV
jgi:hypothetical protein